MLPQEYEDKEAIPCPLYYEDSLYIQKLLQQYTSLDAHFDRKERDMQGISAFCFEATLET